MKIEKWLSVLRVVIVGMSSLSNFNEIGQLIVLAKNIEELGRLEG